MSKVTFCLMLVVAVAYGVQAQGQPVRQTCPNTAPETATACNCLDPADPGLVCLNGGFCMSNNLMSFTCLCPITARGDQCQMTSSGACTVGQECLGTNSICVSVQGGAGACSCDAGFVRGVVRGRDACVALANECNTANQCANGGTCVDLPFGFRCNCRAGFAGNRCQSRGGSGSDEDGSSADSASLASVDSVSSVDSLNR